MILAVEFEDYREEWKALTEGQWQELRGHFPNLPLKKEEYHSWSSDVYIADQAALETIARLEIVAKLKPMPDQQYTMLVKLADRMRQLELSNTQQAEAMLKGGIVQIHIPDFTLMAITEVDYMEDTCTDAVQEMLDKGWRILAICPPNAQRRPDYVFGRSKPKDKK